MIEPFSITSKFGKKHAHELLDLLNNSDLYYTKENRRVFVTDLFSLNRLLRESSHVYVQKEKGLYTGLILLWRSMGSGVKRYYVKIITKNNSTARDLLTTLSWNCGLEVFAKVKKNDPLLNVFKKKGFRFAGSRGVQILLNRKPIHYKIYSKEDD